MGGLLLPSALFPGNFRADRSRGQKRTLNCVLRREARASVTSSVQGRRRVQRPPRDHGPALDLGSQKPELSSLKPCLAGRVYSCPPPRHHELAVSFSLYFFEIMVR